MSLGTVPGDLGYDAAIVLTIMVMMMGGFELSTPKGAQVLCR